MSDGADDGLASRRADVSGMGRATEGRRTPARPRLEPVAAAVRDADCLDRIVDAGPVVDRAFGTERRLFTPDGALDVRVASLPDAAPPAAARAVATQHRRWNSADDIDGVVPVVETGLADRPWVVTAAVDRDPPLDQVDLGTALDEALTLSGTVAALHDRGLIHGAIAPACIAHPPAGAGAGRALTDIGLLDVYRRHHEVTALVDPRYAPPEIFDDDGLVDRSTDVYGLAALCYRRCTGTAPRPDGAAGVEGPVVRPSIREPGLPPELDDILLEALAADPYERFDTVSDFRAAIAGLLESESF
ncbi:MAG: hypothetical protein ABEH64_05470 [Salinirussus sp.]